MFAPNQLRKFQIFFAMSVVSSIAIITLLFEVFAQRAFLGLILPFILLGYLSFFRTVILWISYLQKNRIQPSRGISELFLFIRRVIREESKWNAFISFLWIAILLFSVVYISTFSYIDPQSVDYLPSPIFVGSLPFSSLYMVLGKSLEKAVFV